MRVASVDLLHRWGSLWHWHRSTSLPVLRCVDMSGLDTSRQAKGLYDDLALNMWAGYIEILTDVEPNCFDFLASELNLISEPQDIGSVFQRERTDDILQLDVFDARVFRRQDKDVPVRVLQVMIVLNEVLADDGDFSSC